MLLEKTCPPSYFLGPHFSTPTNFVSVIATPQAVPSNPPVTSANQFAQPTPAQVPEQQAGENNGGRTRGAERFPGMVHVPSHAHTDGGQVDIQM